MKRLFTVTILLILSGCASHNTQSPTQNEALDAVSATGIKHEKKGWMQERLDDWLQNDWEAHTEKYERQEKTKKEEKRFLQYYIDKATYYNSHTPHDDAPPQYEKLDTLPAIGGSKRR